jgi:hypothetical protein
MEDRPLLPLPKLLKLLSKITGDRLDELPDECPGVTLALEVARDYARRAGIELQS